MEQDNIAIAYVSSSIDHSKKGIVKKFFHLIITIVVITFVVNFILVILQQAEDTLFSAFVFVGLLLLFSMVFLAAASDLRDIIIYRSIKNSLSSVLEYELACAENTTSWYRFVFAHCLSKILEKGPKGTILLFSQSEDEEMNIILEDEISNFTVPEIWLLLCQKNFSDNNISLFINETYEVVTFYLKEEKLHLLHLSMAHEDYQDYTGTMGWPDNSFTELIPEAPGTVSLSMIQDGQFSAVLKDVTEDDFKSYVSALEDAGFIKNEDESIDGIFSGTNENGNTVTVQFAEGQLVIALTKGE